MIKKVTTMILSLFIDLKPNDVSQNLFVKKEIKRIKKKDKKIITQRMKDGIFYHLTPASQNSAKPKLKTNAKKLNRVISSKKSRKATVGDSPIDIRQKKKKTRKASNKKKMLKVR
jgi:hypothetical protein